MIVVHFRHILSCKKIVQENSIRLSPVSTHKMWVFALEILLTENPKIQLWSKTDQQRAIAPLFPYSGNSIKNLFSDSNKRFKLPYTKFKNFCYAFETCTGLGQDRQDAFRRWKDMIESEYKNNSSDPIRSANSDVIDSYSDETFNLSTDEGASVKTGNLLPSLQDWKFMRLQNSRWNFYNHEFQLSDSNPVLLAFGGITSGGFIDIEMDFQVYHVMPLWKGKANTTSNGKLLIGTLTNAEDYSWVAQVSIELGSLEQSSFLSGIISIRTNRIFESSLILLVKSGYKNVVKNQKIFLDHLTATQRQNLSFKEDYSLAYSNFLGKTPYKHYDIFGEKTLYITSSDRKSVENFWCKIRSLLNYECEIRIRTKHPILLEGYCFPNIEQEMMCFNLQKWESRRHQKIFYAKHTHYKANQSGLDPFDRKEKAKFQKDLGSLVLYSPFQSNQGIMFGFMIALYKSIFGLLETSEKSIKVFQSPIILLDKSYSLVNREVMLTYLSGLETRSTSSELETLASDLYKDIKNYRK